MLKNYFIFITLLATAALGLSGCANKMARSDDAMAPAGEQAAAMAPEEASQTPAADDGTAAADADAAATDAALPIPLDDSATATGEQDTQTQEEVAAALLPLPSDEVMDTIQKMTQHPRVRYLSRTAQYDYYVGGRLDAKYDVNKHELIIKDHSAADADAVTCTYSKDGEMITNGKALPPKLIEECNDLVNELGVYLSR